MEDYIYTEANANKIADNNTIEVKSYTILGEHDFIDTDNNPRVEPGSTKTLAKAIHNGRRIKYFVKAGAYGRLFNPMGMFSEGKQNKFLSKIGKNEFELKEVNSRIFDLYLNFLTSKNIAWLNNAQRELT